MSKERNERSERDAQYYSSPEIVNRDPHQQFDDERKKTYSEMPRVNILLTGQTGVGKSTLINSVLRKPVANTGVGKPVTDHIRSWSVEGIPITLYDTPGIELDRDSKALAKEYEQLIQAKLAKPEDHVHLAWHCLLAASNRLQDAEVEVIQTISKKVSTILVLTQCLGRDDPEGNKFADKLVELIKDNDVEVEQSRPIMTLAQSRQVGSTTIEPFGLDELVELSYELLPDAQKRSFANAQRVDLQLKVKEARKLVLLASGVAASIGAVPIPIPDAGPLLAVQAGMLGRITVAMGVDLDQGTREFLLKNLLGTSAMAVGGRQMASLLLKWVPVGGPIINAGVAAALTGALGEAFIHLCSEILRRQAAGKPMPQKEMLEMLIGELKRAYQRKKA